MTDIDELEALAKAATEGPWEQGTVDGSLVFFRGKDKGGFDLRNCPNPKETAAFLAAANPAAILKLIGDIRTLQAERDAAYNRGIEDAAKWCDTEAVDILKMAQSYEDSFDSGRAFARREGAKPYIYATRAIRQLKRPTP